MEYWHSLPYSIYCLVMARYCPLPGQLCAIARHETIRREKGFYKIISNFRRVLPCSMLWRFCL